MVSGGLMSWGDWTKNDCFHLIGHSHNAWNKVGTHLRQKLFLMGKCTHSLTSLSTRAQHTVHTPQGLQGMVPDVVSTEAVFGSEHLQQTGNW